MRITRAEFEAMQARVVAHRKPWLRDVLDEATAEKDGFPDWANDKPSRERDLQDRIAKHCRDNGWLYIQSRMDRATTTVKGTPDFVILMNAGTGVLIECKVGKAKLTPEQSAWKLHAENLGHTVHVVRSFKEFLEVVK